MEAVIIMDAARLEKMERNMEMMSEFITKAIAELKDGKKIYLTETEAIELTCMSRTTLYRNRDQIGFSKPAGTIRYKRKDLLDFMNQSYHKNY